MSIIQAVNSKLANDAAITAVVGTRIWYKILPQNPVYPALTFFEVDDIRYQTHDLKIGCSHARFQFDAWATAKGSAETLIEAVVDLLEDFRGDVALAARTVSIDACLFQGLTELFFEYEAEPVLKDLYRKTADFIIWYR